MARSSRVFALWGLWVALSWAAPAAGDIGPLPFRANSRQAGKGKLHIPARQFVRSTTVLNDGAGYRWDIYYTDLRVGQGTNYVYSSGMYLHVHGSNFRSSQAWINAAGDEIEAGPWNRGNVTVYRRCKVYRDRGLARWLDILVNKTAAVQTVPVRIYSSMNGTVACVLTSSKGTTFGQKDWAFITDQRQGRPKLLHVLCGPKAKTRPTIRTSGSSLYVNYTITIPPNGTSVLCYFESQGHTLNELKERMHKFRASRMLRDLSASVRKLIVNFRTSDMLEGIELDRRGTGDAVQLKNGDRIVGRITNKSFHLQTLHGALELPAGQVIGFVGTAGQKDVVRAVLTGGQVITGQLRKAILDLDLPTGGSLRIPFGRISQCSYCISKAKPEETPMKGPLIVLRNGDRLAFEAAKLKCTLLTRHGKVELKGKELMEVRLDHEAHGVHRATFLNGSTLAGLLGPERIVLPLKLARQLDIPRELVLAIRFAAETQEVPGLGRVELSNEDELFGRLADKSYDLKTDFGTIPVKPENIIAMSFDPADPARVRIRLWNDTVLRGRLQQNILRFAIMPGPVLNLHIGQIAAVEFTEALPPEKIVKLVEKYVAMLSAASYKDREEAQEKLIMMKRAIVPLLRRHLKDLDPEVRQRIRTILERLGDGKAGSSNTAPAKRLILPAPVAGRKFFIQ